MNTSFFVGDNVFAFSVGSNPKHAQCATIEEVVADDNEDGRMVYKVRWMNGTSSDLPSTNVSSITRSRARGGRHKDAASVKSENLGIVKPVTLGKPVDSGTDDSRRMDVHTNQSEWVDGEGDDASVTGKYF